MFLTGEAQTEQRRQWAGNLARSTEDVVAVVNQLTVRPAALWDFTPALTSLRALLRAIVLSLPGATALHCLVLTVSGLGDPSTEFAPIEYQTVTREQPNR